MKINRKLLIEALQLVLPGLSPKEVIQQSNCFVFTGSRVYTYNDEIAVSHPLEIGIEGALFAEEFIGLLNKTTQDELDISQVDTSLIIKGHKFKANIKIANEINLPIEEIEPPDEFYPLPTDFVQALQFCLPSCSKDMTKPALTCIHAVDNRVESSNNWEVTVRYFDGTPYFETPIMIPSEAARSLVSFNAVEFASNKGWLYFRTREDTIFSCRTYEQITFPDVSRVLDIQGVAVTLPNDLSDVIARARIFSTSKFHIDEYISVTIQKGRLMIKSKGDAGKFEEISRIRYKGEEKKFDINPELLSHIFKSCKKVEVGDDTLKFEYETERTNGFVHVIKCFVSDNN